MPHARLPFHNTTSGKEADTWRSRAVQRSFNMGRKLKRTSDWRVTRLAVILFNFPQIHAHFCPVRGEVVRVTALRWPGGERGLAVVINREVCNCVSECSCGRVNGACMCPTPRF